MAKTILESTQEVQENKKLKYQMTAGQKMTVIKELNDGDVINVNNWCVFVDEKENADDVTILTIQDGNTGTIFCTNSETFRRSFLDIADIYKDEGKIGFDIEKMSGTTKSNRTYINCSLV